MKYDENPYHTPDWPTLTLDKPVQYTLRDYSQTKISFPAFDKYIEDKKKEITEHADKEIERIKEVFETKTMDPND
jgi:hypothetical protein